MKLMKGLCTAWEAAGRLGWALHTSSKERAAPAGRFLLQAAYQAGSTRAVDPSLMVWGDSNIRNAFFPCLPALAF